MKTSKYIYNSDNSNKLSHSLFFVFAGLLLVVYIVINPSGLSIEQAQQLTGEQESRSISYLVSFLIMLLCALTPVPAEVIALANTMIYSPVEAFMVTWLSALVSANIGYELGRLNCFDPCKTENSKICRWLSCYGYKGLALMRLVPIVPFFALNICGGLFKLDRFKYTVITSLTIIPAAALLTFFPHLFL